MEDATPKPQSSEGSNHLETENRSIIEPIYSQTENYAESPQLPGLTDSHHRPQSIPGDSTTLQLDKSIPSILRKPRDEVKFFLKYWAECRAVICTRCVELDELLPPPGALLCKEDAVIHLASHHPREGTDFKALRHYLNELPSLARINSEVGRPVPNLHPRAFLKLPEKGWCCPICQVCTVDFRIIRWHWDIHHHEPLEKSNFSPRLVLTQHIDSFYFPVISILENYQAGESQSDEYSALERFLGMIQHLKDCNTLICLKCESQAVLCKNTIFTHLRNYHALDFQDLEEATLKTAIDELSPLAKDPEAIRLPKPGSKAYSNFRPPVDGWTCSCGYASPDQNEIKEHSCEDQTGLFDGELKIDAAMLQYVTLSERLYFPVHVEGSDREDSDQEDDDMSSVSGSTETYLSQTNDLFQDTYTKERRKDILAMLWENPSSANLKKLSSSGLLHKMRTLAIHEDPLASKIFRRCDNAFVLALLRVQHSIIRTEEKISQGNMRDVEDQSLTDQLLLYATLIKSYKELLGSKQPGQLESRRFGRYMGAQLHEPRYFYSPDALNLIDLRIERPRGKHDIIRKILQQKLPVRFLDQTGKERRVLDEAEEKRELPSGGMARIIEQYRLQGGYISPSVDNTARIIFGLVGGLFLLIPMIAMAYITSKTYLLITTVMFVLLFSVSLGLASKSSNQELVGATAAYAAVLVVFVSNSIGHV